MKTLLARLPWLKKLLAWLLWLKSLLPWLLWLWIGLVLVASYLLAPPLAGFVGGGESSRLLFFHVPMAWTSFVAFLAAGIWSALYLYPKTRNRRHDLAAAAAVEIGLVFGLLATLSGAVWGWLEWGGARWELGALNFWRDPRLTSIMGALIYYAAYMALRSQVTDAEVRGRITGAYAVLGLFVAPFLFFIAPRMAASTLHPEPVVNSEADVQMDPLLLWLLLAGSLGFTVLFFWMHNLATRLAVLEDLTEAPE